MAKYESPKANADNKRPTNTISDADSREYNVGNRDYENDMRYGRSGIISDHEGAQAPQPTPSVKPGLEEEESSDDYETGKRSAGTYDEDDYDSNYGNSNDYRDQTFDNHLSGGFKQSYDKQDHIPDQDQYGRSYKKSNNDYDNHIEDEIIIDRRESPQHKENSVRKSSSSTDTGKH